MNVILLTVFIGLILVGLAIVLFFYTRASSEGSSPEQDSLMPLQEEMTRPAGGKTKNFPSTRGGSQPTTES